MVTRARFGRTTLGCLVQLLLFSAVIYFGVGIGQVYWEWFQLQDRMKQEARFAASRTDGVIKRRVSMFADSLGLPEGARTVHVKRANKHIYIWSEYYVNVELPFYTRQILLNPQVEWPY